MSPQIAIPIRVDALRNAINPAESAVDVTVFRTDLRDFVVIEDIGEGPAMAQAAESICPQVSERLMLPWRRCVFVERYRARAGVAQFDATFDHILFKGEPVAWHVPTCPDPLPLCKQVRRVPLDLRLARAVQAAGLPMSSHIGTIGHFESTDDGVQFDAFIAAYDGRRYYTTGDIPIRGHLLGPADAPREELADA